MLKNYTLPGSLLLVILLVVFGVSFTHNKNKAHADPAGAISITTDDLAQAGYSGATEQPPQDNLYQLPNLYFWVHEDLKSKDNTSNLLMVSQYTSGSNYTDTLFSYGTSTHSVFINGTSAQEGKLADGRTALNFSKGTYYLVIIGPNAKKVEALAVLLAAKI